MDWAGPQRLPRSYAQDMRVLLLCKQMSLQPFSAQLQLSYDTSSSKAKNSSLWLCHTESTAELHTITSGIFLFLGLRIHTKQKRSYLLLGTAKQSLRKLKSLWKEMHAKLALGPRSFSTRCAYNIRVIFVNSARSENYALYLQGILPPSFCEIRSD